MQGSRKEFTLRMRWMRACLKVAIYEPVKLSILIVEARTQRVLQ
jgi:hypothetical protein